MHASSVSCVFGSIFIVNKMFDIEKIRIEGQTFQTIKLTNDAAPIVADRLLYGSDYVPHVLPLLPSPVRAAESYMLQMAALTTRPALSTPEVGLRAD